MKKIILIAVMVAAAAVAGNAQVLQCVTNKAKFDPYRYTPPVWETIDAASITVKLRAGTEWVIPFRMPVRGRCAGSFDAFDDRDDVAVVVMDAAKNYIRQQPAGDIELLILDVFGMANRNGRRNYASWFSSGRQTSGSFDIDLPAGDYFIVLSNTHSYLAPKSVNFTLGRNPIE
jgi:hypothetical protein